MTKAEKKRFKAKIQKGKKKGDCWLWTGATKNGYGYFVVKLKNGTKKKVYAHRISCKLYKKENIKGFKVIHTCGNKLCQNHRHLDRIPMGTVVGNGEITDIKVVKKDDTMIKDITNKRIKELISKETVELWRFMNKLHDMLEELDPKLHKTHFREKEEDKS